MLPSLSAAPELTGQWETSKARAAKRFRENAELPLPRARGVLSPAPTVARLAGNCWCSSYVSNWNYDAHPAARVVAAIVYLVYVSRDVGL